MKMSNQFVEIETVLMGNRAAAPITIRFPLTKAEITITNKEARELWSTLDKIYGD